MSNKIHIVNLKKAYKERKLVPFIGAGLGIPFDIPSWEGLIKELAKLYIEEKYIPSIYRHIELGNYWDAIRDIKEFSVVSDMDIQEQIVEMIRTNMNKEVEETSHNYLDIARMNFNNIFTTNYDFLINKFMKNNYAIPQVLHKVEMNSQLFFGNSANTNVWHLHGHISDPGSIIISKEKYEELYSNDKYGKIFDIFQANGVFLFIGFSMKDLYIQNTLNKNKGFYNSKHYILLDRPNREFVQELKQSYNINVISYDSTEKGHAFEIRKILNEISGDDINKEVVIDNIESIDNMELIKKISICKEIKRLLIENNRIFISYGPKSEIAIENPLSNAYQIWEKRKYEKIIPNNDIITKLINDNKELFDIAEYEICYEFIEHANAFKKSCNSIIEDVKQFPKEFDEVISRYAKI